MEKNLPGPGISAYLPFTALRLLFPIIPVCLFMVFWAWTLFAAPVTVMAPDRHIVENKAQTESRKNSHLNRQAEDEVDVLICLLEPFKNQPFDMDRPSLFAAVYYPPGFNSADMQPVLRNLLGDVEEIRYLDKKAWGANVSVAEPGLYQFILEAKPWWDEKRNRYVSRQVKTILPVKGGGEGWNTPFGQSFEILPLTRPFGLTAPALFSARALLDGKPLENVPVRMGLVTTAPRTSLSQWHETLEARTDAAGEFAFVLNEPGWWYCEAVIDGAPLKGPDGEMKEQERTTVLWLFVDGQAAAKNRSQKK